jgi:hypothetical protein
VSDGAIAAIIAAVVVGFVVIVTGLIIWFVKHEPKRPRGGGPVLQDDVVYCGGCGCMLPRGEEYKMPSTVGTETRLAYPGALIPSWREHEVVREHYLCLRCQVDGNPPRVEGGKEGQVSTCSFAPGAVAREVVDAINRNDAGIRQAIISVIPDGKIDGRSIRDSL